MLETKCVGDKFKMLATDFSVTMIKITNITLSPMDLTRRTNIKIFLVLREPTFLIVANPVQKYHPIQMNFLGKNLKIAFHSWSSLKRGSPYRPVWNIFLDHQIKGTDFNLGDGTEAYFACSTVFQGETLVLGGKRELNQVSFQIFAIIIFHIWNSLVNLNPVDW